MIIAPGFSELRVDSLLQGNVSPHAVEEGAFRHADPIVDAALDWFMRIGDGGLNADEQAEFESWKQQDPKHLAAFQRLDGMSRSSSLAKAGAEMAREERALRPVVVDQPAASRQHWGRYLVPLAAVLVLAIALYPTLRLSLLSDYRTAVGEQRVVSLPDGSSMTLNSGSAVALDFDNGRRSVSLLQGEAYFDVVHDAEHPFVVNGALSQTQVFGTAFAVQDGAEADRVVLQRGSVQVALLEAPYSMQMLEPGEAVHAARSGISSPKQVNVSDMLAWLNGRVVFENALFSEALETLERYHSGLVFVVDDRYEGARISGDFSVEDPATAVATLAAAVGGNITRLPGGVLILK